MTTRATPSSASGSPDGGGGRRRGRPRGRTPELPETGSTAADTQTDQEQLARSIALRLLTSAPRTRKQLADAMALKDVPDGVAERVLDRFTAVGLIDDAEYAAILVRTRHSERGLARRALAQELTRKGIDAETAATALEAVGREEEDDVARDLVRRRAGASSGLSRERRERRLVAMLARKGHPPSAAFRIVREELDRLGTADDADHPSERWGSEGDLDLDSP